MFFLVLVLLLILMLHLDVKVAIGVDVNVEVALLHSCGCKLYSVVVLSLFNVDGWCGGICTRHEVGIKKVIENFRHPSISHYW